MLHWDLAIDLVCRLNLLDGLRNGFHLARHLPTVSCLPDPGVLGDLGLIAALFIEHDVFAFALDIEAHEPENVCVDISIDLNTDERCVPLIGIDLVECPLPVRMVIDHQDLGLFPRLRPHHDEPQFPSPMTHLLGDSHNAPVHAEVHHGIVQDVVHPDNRLFRIAIPEHQVLQGEQLGTGRSPLNSLCEPNRFTNELRSIELHPASLLALARALNVGSLDIFEALDVFETVEEQLLDPVVVVVQRPDRAMTVEHTSLFSCDVLITIGCGLTIVLVIDHEILGLPLPATLVFAVHEERALGTTPTIVVRRTIGTSPEPGRAGLVVQPGNAIMELHRLLIEAYDGVLDDCLLPGTAVEDADVLDHFVGVDTTETQSHLETTDLVTDRAPALTLDEEADAAHVVNVVVAIVQDHGVETLLPRIDQTLTDLTSHKPDMLLHVFLVHLSALFRCSLEIEEDIEPLDLNHVVEVFLGNVFRCVTDHLAHVVEPLFTQGTGELGELLERVHLVDGENVLSNEILVGLPGSTHHFHALHDEEREQFGRNDDRGLGQLSEAAQQVESHLEGPHIQSPALDGQQLLRHGRRMLLGILCHGRLRTPVKVIQVTTVCTNSPAYLEWYTDALCLVSI